MAMVCSAGSRIWRERPICWSKCSHRLQCGWPARLAEKLNVSRRLSLPVSGSRSDETARSRPWIGISSFLPYPMRAKLGDAGMASVSAAGEYDRFRRLRGEVEGRLFWLAWVFSGTLGLTWRVWSHERMFAARRGLLEAELDASNRLFSAVFRTFCAGLLGRFPRKKSSFACELFLCS